jgi:hypothetical protein
MPNRFRVEVLMWTTVDVIAMDEAQARATALRIPGVLSLSSVKEPEMIPPTVATSSPGR